MFFRRGWVHAGKQESAGVLSGQGKARTETQRLHGSRSPPGVSARSPQTVQRWRNMQKKNTLQSLCNDFWQSTLRLKVEMHDVKYHNILYF